MLLVMNYLKIMNAVAPPKSISTSDVMFTLQIAVYWKFSYVTGK